MSAASARFSPGVQHSIQASGCSITVPFGLGFAIGALAGIVVGMAVGFASLAEAVIMPIIAATFPIPKIALLPLFILWFGLGVGSKIALGVSLTFFIVLSSTVAGIRGVSQDHVTLTRTLGASSRQMFFSVTLPGAVPVLFSGLRLGVIYALLGVVGAGGLGQLLSFHLGLFHMPKTATLLLAMLALVLLVDAGSLLARRVLTR